MLLLYVYIEYIFRHINKILIFSQFSKLQNFSGKNPSFKYQKTNVNNKKEMVTFFIL